MVIDYDVDFGWDEDRQFRTVGKWVGPEKLKIYYLQKLPDNFAQVNRDKGAEWGGLIGNTQKHRVPIWTVPDALTNQWFMEDKHLDPDEKDKKMRERMNDPQYRDLRIWQGKV